MYTLFVCLLYFRERVKVIGGLCYYVQSVNDNNQILFVACLMIQLFFQMLCCAATLQLESFKSFDFDEWRQRYIAWLRDKKFRMTDFFRRQDKRGEGMLIREQFVEGMMASSKLPVQQTFCTYI